MIAFKNLKNGDLIIDGKGKVIADVQSIDLYWRRVWYIVRDSGSLRSASYRWLMNYYYFVKSRKNDKV